MYIFIVFHHRLFSAGGKIKNIRLSPILLAPEENCMIRYFLEYNLELPSDQFCDLKNSFTTSIIRMRTRFPEQTKITIENIFYYKVEDLLTYIIIYNG